MSTVKCVGILTSGGDAPGMNAAIRAVTRSAIYNGMRVKGIYRGYKGLILDEIEEFKTQNVSNIIQRGGTGWSFPPHPDRSARTTHQSRSPATDPAGPRHRHNAW